MSEEKKYKYAEATFSYTAGGGGVNTGDLTVSENLSNPSSRDDCLINLALKAGNQISNTHGVELRTIVLKLFDFDGH